MKKEALTYLMLMVHACVHSAYTDILSKLPAMYQAAVNSTFVQRAYTYAKLHPYVALSGATSTAAFSYIAWRKFTQTDRSAWQAAHRSRSQTHPFTRSRSCTWVVGIASSICAAYSVGTYQHDPQSACIAGLYAGAGTLFNTYALGSLAYDMYACKRARATGAWKITDMLRACYYSTLHFLNPYVLTTGKKKLHNSPRLTYLSLSKSTGSSYSFANRILLALAEGPQDKRMPDEEFMLLNHFLDEDFKNHALQIKQNFREQMEMLEREYQEIQKAIVEKQAPLEKRSRA